MRDILDAVAEGELSPEAAEARLRGYVTTPAGRFDAARQERSGVPEAVLATGKTTSEIVTLCLASLEATGRVLVTRLDDRNGIEDAITEEWPEANVERYDRSGVLLAHTPDYEARDLNASVCVVTGGTSDAIPADEATVVAREMGATVERLDDVGVASLPRLLDRVDDLREHDVLIVAAGREGALPTVVAGQVDVPVIGLPVSNGYGHGGDGEAALAGMLQSCTSLSVVNVDAGFTAGVQAGLTARQLHEARTGE